jgi:hypothetical protein
VENIWIVFGTPLVYAPNQEVEHNLKVKAFLNIDIFKRVLEYYKGSNLPDMKYLGNTLQKEFDLAFLKLMRNSQKCSERIVSISASRLEFQRTLVGTGQSESH